MTVSLSRQIKESPLYIGANEVIAYTVDFAGFVPSAVSALTTPICTLANITTGTEVDVSATNLSGSASFSSLVMTTKTFTGLSADAIYLLRCRGTASGATYELWAIVNGER